MSDIIYIDTNIWLDYCLGTSDIRPLDEFAKQLLDRSISCEFQIVISDLLLKELQKYIDSPDELLSDLKEKTKLIYTTITKEDIKTSKQIKVHYPDNLHVAISKRIHVKYFVTNDKEILSLNKKYIVDSQFFQF